MVRSRVNPRGLTPKKRHKRADIISLGQCARRRGGGYSSSQIYLVDI